MRRRVLAVPCLLMFAACSAGGAGAQGSPGDGSAGERSDGGLPSSFGDVSAVACRGERDMLTAAVEAYVLLTPSTPVSEAALVEERFLRDTSEWFDIEPDGAVVAAPGSPCA